MRAGAKYWGKLGGSLCSGGTICEIAARFLDAAYSAKCVECVQSCLH